MSSDLLAGGKLTSSPSNFQQFIGSRGRPEWSPTGDRLAYQSCSPLGGGPCTLWIRQMDTGSQRELKLKLGYFFFPRWSPDGRELVVRARDLRGRNDGLYRIDVESGETTLVVTPYPGQSLPQWAADGRHVYYRRGTSIVQRSLASGDERDVVRIPTERLAEFAMSPDGQHVVYLGSQATPGSEGLFLMRVAGGEPRLLLSAKAPERLMFRFDWTADGAAIAAVTRHDDNGNQVLWLIPTDGGKPRRLDVDIDNWLIGDGFKFDRAGKRVAFAASAGQPGLEIRALENFLPAAATSAAPKR